MLAREKSLQGYRDPEKAALLRAEHKRDRDGKRDDRRGDDRKDDGKTAARNDSDSKPRAGKKNKKPRTAKRCISNPKEKIKCQKISCHCPKSPTPPLPPAPICDDACCQYDAECQQSSSKEDVELAEKDTRVTTMTCEKNVEEDRGCPYEQRERARERNFKKKMDDTCSCASCVLKKMCHNDCICCCCVAVVFVFCLFLAFVLVCKSIPCLSSKLSLFGPSDDMESDRLKRKIDVPADSQWDGLDKKSNKWDYDRLPVHPVPHSIDSTSYGDINLSHESDLMKILDSDKLSEIQGNQRLREFYKKLVSTDAEIRKLKKDYLFNADTSNSARYPDRAKRSLDILKSPFRMFRAKKKKKQERITEVKPTEAAEVKKPKKEQVDKIKATKSPRDKRFDTNEDGLLIEKKKVSIHFVPNTKKTFKCSHGPKDVNNQFYQNTQRLDELLDKFLDKNDMDLMGEPNSRSVITMKKFKHKNVNNPAPTKNYKTENDEKGNYKVNFDDANNKMLDNSFRNKNNKKIEHMSVDDNLKLLDDQIAKSKMLNEHYSKNSQQIDLDSLQEFLNTHGGATRGKAKVKAKAKARITTDNTKKKNVLIKGNTETSTRNYNLLMSISTMLYKDTDHPSPTKKPDDIHKAKDHVPAGRRLLQFDVDDDEEVYVMPASEQDGARRERREEDMNPNNIINPNWKGAMPLYPEELSAVHKPSPVVVPAKENHDSLSVQFTGAKNRKLYGFKSHGAAKNFEPKHLTDMEYIGDYFRNKYNKEAEMAQAYSDYGVLDDKHIKNQQGVDQRFRNHVKVDSEKTPGIKLRGNENSLSFNSPKEGFKLQFIPPTPSFDGIINNLRKHISFTGTPNPEATTKTTLAGPTFITTKRATEIFNVKNIHKPLQSEFKSFKKRSLKSFDEYQNDDPSEAIESLMNFRSILNGLQKKFSTKLGSAQDYAMRVATDYIHDGIYKRDVNVDDDINGSVADDNITVSDNNMTDTVKLVTNDTDNSTAQTETGVIIATSDVGNDTGATLSDFFMKLAHWFSLLDALDLSANKSQQGNFSATNATEKAKNQPKFESIFPLYDADMIENIGHRSRILLAVNETPAVDDSTPDGEGKIVADAKGVGVVGTEIDNTTTTRETFNAKANKTKSIVKRHAGNLLWDDVYNDDYGADVDMDGDGGQHVQSSASKASKPAEKRRPKEWFKKIVNIFKEGAVKRQDKLGSEGDAGHRECGDEGKPKLKKAKLIEDRASERFYRKADEYQMEEKKTDFPALTAKMKKICQKAAKDISLSKKLEVREESKEGQVASKLMQQLVSLMSDLVDYQVHEKTCRKLPMDLQNFLEWLTNPDSSVISYHGKDVALSQGNRDVTHEETTENFHSLGATPPDEEMEPKTDSMRVITAVRDLLNRYDSLSDEDKSKMSGVKEYLEAQLEYLEKQMYMIDDFNMLNTDIPRYKRDAEKSNPDPHPSKLRSAYVTFKKYMRKQNEDIDDLTKNVYASNNESTTSKVMTVSFAIEKVPNKVKPRNDMVKITKRNLKDVYYRALEEAKLMTAATVEAKLTTALPPKTTDY